MVIHQRDFDAPETKGSHYAMDYQVTITIVWPWHIAMCMVDLQQPHVAMSLEWYNYNWGNYPNMAEDFKFR